MTTKVVERAMDTIDSLVSDLKKAGDKLGPKAIKAARSAVKVSAVNWIISGTISTLMALAFAIVAWKLYSNMPHCSTNLATYYDCSNYRFYMGAFSGGFTIAAFIMLSVASGRLLDIWTWVALRNPDLWIADQVLDRLLNPGSGD